MAEKIGAVNSSLSAETASSAGRTRITWACCVPELRDSEFILVPGSASRRVAMQGRSTDLRTANRPRELSVRRANDGAHLVSSRFEVIVNATPVGMYPHAGTSPLSPRELNCDFVMDLIYRPLRTQLLRIAAKKGIKVISGVEMFLAQGFAQWQLWTGKLAPEAEMRRAVAAKLRLEERHGKKNSTFS